MQLDDLPRLCYFDARDPGTAVTHILAKGVTCIGRLKQPDAVPPGADCIRLDGRLETVSNKHAQVIRVGNEYHLCNWNGRHGIGFYARELRPGDGPVVLRHYDEFRIPDREEYIRFRFLEDGTGTKVEPFLVELNRAAVYVFGQRVRLAPTEFRIVAYLYQHQPHLCRTAEIIRAVFPDEPNPFDRENHLDVSIHTARGKLNKVSGGREFIQNVRGFGYRLVL